MKCNVILATAKESGPGKQRIWKGSFGKRKILGITVGEEYKKY